MFRPAIPLAASLLVMLAACATTDESTASTDASTPSTAADTQTASSTTTDTTGSPTTGSTTTNTAPSGCNADAARSLVGQVASSQIIDQARSAAGAETARTLKPGQAVTMEFNGNRLNLDVDANNTITNVRCG